MKLNKKITLLPLSLLTIIILLTAAVLTPGIDAYAGTSTFKFEEKKVTVPLRFDYYYSYDMAVEAMKKLHRAYPGLTKLDLVGKSDEGRAIYAITVNNPKTGKALDKPGIYVDGNIHGNEIQGTEVSLYLLDYLLGNYGKIDEITQLVDKKCFYVIPMINVDGRYHFFADANTASSSRGLRRPHDDDSDGLLDEDFPDDLDGDGNICRMRIRDPHGRFKTDPEDPRNMVRVKPGEKGEWRRLGLEGIDNDGDGKINEDAEGYVDPNRNWGFDWMPNYVQEGSGDYPFSGEGIKAIGKFIRQRPNIAMAWAFHNFGGMILRGPSTKSQPPYPPRDIRVYDYLGYQSERIIPFYRYLISWKDLYATYGEFSEWMSMINGAYGFLGELFASGEETFKTFKESEKPKLKEEDPGIDFFSGSSDRERQRLQFNDHLGHSQLFKPWKPFKHPTYGDIEIGGWTKFSSRIPAPFMIKDMIHRNASAVIFSAKHTPEITMEVFDKRKMGKNLYRIRVRLVNGKAMPSMSYHARQKKLYPQDMLKVSGKKVNVVAGGKINDVYTDEVSYKEHRPEIQFLTVPGFGKVEYQFLVSGSGSITLDYNSVHAGKIKQNVSLK
ncbi:MAG: hypothetical protein GY940_32530 [bacterium]|nr:hypothetical protein [bacterium]